MFYGVASMSRTRLRLVTIVSRTAKTVQSLTKRMAWHWCPGCSNNTMPIWQAVGKARKKHRAPLLLLGHRATHLFAVAHSMHLQPLHVCSGRHVAFHPAHITAQKEQLQTLATFALSVRIHISHEILRPQHCTSTPVARLSCLRLSRSTNSCCMQTRFLRQQPTRVSLTSVRHH